ncbi:hypothetical protein [Spiroplasma endosymbiont of Agriotes lineatus]|uniref:hypothetical protein n=1 Tax=Spiroplasma endosymbiont of Agriotes lineatus TaxID=3077930 RepID=UPI0030CC9E8F
MLDKLEAIPNFNVNLQWNDFLKVINECGMSIISQTQDINITTDDNKIYALRDKITLRENCWFHSFNSAQRASNYG